MTGARAILAAVVDGDALLELVAVSLVAGLAVTVAASVAVAATARAGTYRRAGRPGPSLAWALAATLAVALCAAALAAGVVIMASKS